MQKVIISQINRRWKSKIQECFVLVIRFVMKGCLKNKPLCNYLVFGIIKMQNAAIKKCRVQQLIVNLEIDQMAVDEVTATMKQEATDKVCRLMASCLE